jgi:hypothetical protein
VLVGHIRARGGIPFLHAVAANTGAIRLYEAMGFELRQTTVFRVLQTPVKQETPAEPVAALGD